MFSHREALLKASRMVGTQALISKIIGVSPARYNNWVNRDKAVPAKYAIAIEYATQGLVKRWELCPALALEEPCLQDILAKLTGIETRVANLEKKTDIIINNNAYA